MKKTLKSFEVIVDKKSHYVSAFTKKEVVDFFAKRKPTKIIERKDIDPSTNFTIS